MGICDLDGLKLVQQEIYELATEQFMQGQTYQTYKEKDICDQLINDYGIRMVKRSKKYLNKTNMNDYKIKEELRLI